MGRYGWKNLDGVVVTSGGTFGEIAQCDGCSWGEEQGESYGRALTGRAKTHVRKTGHVVHVIRSRQAKIERES